MASGSALRGGRGQVSDPRQRFCRIAARLPAGSVGPSDHGGWQCECHRSWVLQDVALHRLPGPGMGKVNCTRLSGDQGEQVFGLTE